MTGEISITTFEIDPRYFIDVMIRKEWSIYDGRETLTDEELIILLKGEDRRSSVHSEDHPEFTALRNTLEADGYIRTDRGCWNADRVIKSFILNDVLFEPGEKFVCATAIRWHMEHSEKIMK